MVLLRLTKVVGRHTIKVGYEQYFYRFHEKGGDHTGVAWINPGGGSNQTWNNIDGLTGSPLAELMMGSSNFFQWGNWDITPFGWNQAAYRHGRLEGEQQAHRADRCALGS